MKKCSSQRGEVLIGFILVASIILVLIYCIVDLARYTTLKSTVQTATMDVVQYAKSEDALLQSPYDPLSPATPKYLLARQSLSRIFNINPLLQQAHTQLEPVKVAHYGAASGPEVELSVPEYVAYLPPGTSAQFTFPDGTTQWVHHSVCCDPTVNECPEAQRRTTSSNPCNNVEYPKLIGEYPTEFVSAAVVKNSQILASNVITRSSGFPRVQLTAVVPTTTTTTTTTIENICIKIEPPKVTSSCAFNPNTKKFVITSVSENGCESPIASITYSDPQEKCDPKVGIVYYLGSNDDCKPVVKTELPQVSNTLDCQVDVTGKILTTTTNNINQATCALVTATVSHVRPPAACVEHDGALWHNVHERNLLTCDWDPSSTKVQSKPTMFCGINPTTGKYEMRNYVPDFATCTYQLSTEPIATQDVQCSIDPITGNGLQTAYTFSQAACQFVVGTTETKPRPTAVCQETLETARATFTNYHDFIRDGSICVWRADVSEILAPAKTCSERLNSSTNTYEAVKNTPTLHLDMEARPAVCSYTSTESVTQKPADSSCTQGSRGYVKKTYTLNNSPDICGYTESTVPCERVDCQVSDWTGTVPKVCGQKYTMTRTVTQPAQNGGKECPVLTEERSTEPCPPPVLDCQVSDWTGTVPPACGQKYTMTRTVTQPAQNGGKECPVLTEERSTDPCPKIDCQVSDWTGTVPITCGQSYTMTRTVTTQAQNGGKECPVLTEERSTDPCPKIDCQVSDWSKPRHFCGAIYTVRRTITQAPQNGGKECPALTEERTGEPCPPVDCQVNEWVIPTLPACGQNYTVTRTVKTQPVNGGAACPNLTELRTTAPCPINCRVSDWIIPTLPGCGTNYSVTRTVTQQPANGGTACPALTETRTTSPCQKQCIWVATWANCSGVFCTSASGYGADLFSHSGDTHVDELSAVPGCFSQRFAAGCPGYSSTANGTIYGGCGGGTLSVSADLGGWGIYTATGRLGPADLADFLGVPTEIVPSSYRSSDGALSLTSGASWYMDGNCHYVANTTNTKVCGFAGVSWSPVSLLLGDSKLLNQDMTVVPFSIDPKMPDSYSLWKASDKAPLLVYDPESIGKVESARQLFGNYAFGGKTMQPSNYQVNQLREPWSNGFEALGLLDANEDAVLSGEELSDLKLWFDKNRDGVVDSGEIRALKDDGITKIFYKNPKNVSDSQDLEISVGFERVVDGKITTGRSVDWYSKTFVSKQEAVDAVRAEFSQNTKVDSPKKFSRDYILPVELSGNPGKFRPHGVTNHSEDLSGFWIWNTKDKEGAVHPGLFALEQNGERVYGYSVVETNLEKNEIGVRSAIAIYPLEGRVKVNRDNSKTFEFSIHDVNGEGEGVSGAILKSNGEVLAGETNQSFSVEKEGQTHSASVKYEWIARKFVASPTTHE